MKKLVGLIRSGSFDAHGGLLRGGDAQAPGAGDHDVFTLVETSFLSNWFRCQLGRGSPPRGQREAQARAGRMAGWGDWHGIRGSESEDPLRVGPVPGVGRAFEQAASWPRRFRATLTLYHVAEFRLRALRVVRGEAQRSWPTLGRRPAAASNGGAGQTVPHQVVVGARCPPGSGHRPHRLIRRTRRVLIV